MGLILCKKKKKVLADIPRVLVVLDLEVITSLGTPDKIGEPKGLDTRDTEPQANAMGGTSFYGAKQEPQESKSQVQRQISTGSTRSNGSGGGGMSHNGSVIYPVEALSPYNSKWTIKVRVRSKPPIRTWHKASGEGKLFNVILFDETGDIRMTGFNDAVDRWYDVLQEGQVYYISGCKVRMAQRKLDARASDYEMVIDRDTVIEKAEDDGSVPQVRLNLCNIQDLQNVEANTIVDVLGVIKEIGPVDSIISKTTQKPFDKRDITLVDDTGYSVRLTLWGKQATSFDATEESIVAFKDCKVSDFNGRSLSLLSSGSWSADPDIPEAHRLKGWYDSMGRTQSFLTHKSMSSVGAATGRKDDFKTVRQVKDENLGMGEQPDYFSLKGTIVAIKQDNFCYPSCLTDNPPCNKKVTDMGDGTWRCEKCDVTHDRARYRYNLGVMVSDHTGHLWVTCFDDIANVVMGRTADELVSLQGDKAALDAIFEEASCQKLTFRVRAKMDTFGDMPR